MLPAAETCTTALVDRDPDGDGRFFVAVRSTGIYCRPVCKVAPPLPKNRLFVASAAAAHAAGYRPCLRCRPELAPDLGTRHPNPIIARAMRLIEAGAIGQLAGRLAIPAATLRETFVAELGATPEDVADCRRLLLAKQLISDTGLAPAQIAAAVGFADHAALDSELRRRFGRAAEDFPRPPASDASAITLRLPFKPPYHWAAMVGFLATRAIAGVEHVTVERYERSIGLAGALGTVAVEPDPCGSALRAEIRFPLLSALPAILARLRRMFDLGCDPAAIGARLSGDAAMASLVAARPGLRVPGAWDGFELAVRAILGQQITVSGARALAGKLATCGTELPGDGPVRRVFPAPGQLAVRDLALFLGMPRARGTSLSALAREAAADPDLFAPGPDLDGAVRRLRALPGIGEWTAQYIALRALGEVDAFPAADIGLLRAMATPAGRPTPQALLAHAERWRPWRAYAAQHLWVAPVPAKKEGLLF